MCLDFACAPLGLDIPLLVSSVSDYTRGGVIFSYMGVLPRVCRFPVVTALIWCSCSYIRSLLQDSVLVTSLLHNIHSLSSTLPHDLSSKKLAILDLYQPPSTPTVLSPSSQSCHHPSKTAYTPGARHHPHPRPRYPLHASHPPHDQIALKQSTSTPANDKHKLTANHNHTPRPSQTHLQNHTLKRHHAPANKPPRAKESASTP
jgi:hypothetical protein